VSTLRSEYYVTLAVQLALSSRAGLYQGSDTDLACVPFSAPVQWVLIYLVGASSEAVLKVCLTAASNKVSALASAISTVFSTFTLLVLICSASAIFVLVFLLCTNIDQGVWLVWEQHSPLFLRLLLCPALEAGTTLWIVWRHGGEEVFPLPSSQEWQSKKPEDGKQQAKNESTLVSNQKELASEGKEMTTGEDVAAASIQTHLKKQRKKADRGQEHGKNEPTLASDIEELASVENLAGVEEDVQQHLRRWNI